MGSPIFSRYGWVGSELQDLTVYSSWLHRIEYGGMAYLASERHIAPRRDPRLLWPDVRSILAVATPYPHPLSFSFPHNGYPFGRIASYAWQTDYHLTMSTDFERLVRELSVRLGRDVQWRGFTDSAPILERQMAVQAGLGWIGKNGCLIHPRTGSFFLLGEIFTNLLPEQVLTEVSTPLQIPDRCGTCHRCLEICPTGCIHSDRTLDASRCISYLTIEHKGIIPRDLRPALGNWIFGCDLCQIVCPWNHQVEEKHMEFTLAVPSPYPDLVDLLRMSELEFKETFARTALLRPKRTGLIRNVCIALGNTTDPESVQALVQTLSDERDAVIRVHAAWALGQFRSQVAVDSLQKAVLGDPDERVREECRISLIQYQ